MPRKSKRKEDSGSAILRAIGIIEAVAGSETPQPVSDLVHRLGLPKPTVHRIVAMLEREGILEREPELKRVVPGPRVIALAFNAILNSAYRGPWHAVLQALHHSIGETCSFSMLYGNEVVVLDRIESTWALRLQVTIGSRVPAHCTASGKLFLALMPRKMRERLIARAPLTRYTPNTIVDPERLESVLVGIRKARVGTDSEEYLSGLVGVAVPVMGPGGRIFATVSVNAPAARMSPEGALKHVPSLQQAAATLSRIFSESDR